MNRIIPRELIKHLEWTPGKTAPANPRTHANPQNPGTPDPLQVKADVSKYIRVEMNGIYGKPVVISPFELEGYNNLQYNQTHYKLLESGLYMPTPSILTSHFRNIIAAHKGDRRLMYADGNPVEDETVEKLFKHYTEVSGNVYGATDVGAWTWLNSKFVKGEGFNNFNIETVIGIDKTKKKKSLQVKSEPLEECLWEDCWTDISLNVQGLAAQDSKSSKSENLRGETMYFWYPRQDCVARFFANSDRTDLVCLGDPTSSYSSLGVFACAEGADAKIGDAS